MSAAAARHNPQIPHIFDSSTESCSIVVSEEDGTPGLNVLAIPLTSAQPFEQYRDAILCTHHAVLQAADTEMVLDLHGARRPLGRLLNTEDSDPLALLAAFIDMGDHEAITINLIDGETGETVSATVPIVVEAVPVGTL